MRLPTDKQIERVIDIVLAKMRAEGVTVARIDVLDTGVSFSTIAAAPAPGDRGAGMGSAYDDWKKQDHDRAAPSQKAA